LKFFLDTANLDELVLDQFLMDWAKVFQETPAAG